MRLDRLFENIICRFKGIHNSSNKLVRNLQGEKYFLTNSFEGLKRDIENLGGEYEQVYMFGLDKALKDSVRIEKCAEKDGERIYTQMQLSGIEECLKNNAIPYSVSHNSTHYLCNEAYFYMLKKMNGTCSLCPYSINKKSDRRDVTKASFSF